MEQCGRANTDVIQASIPHFHTMFDSLKAAFDHDVAMEKQENIQDELLQAYIEEISTMYHYAARCAFPKIKMTSFKRAGKQWIADFSVSDMAKPEKEQYNFHLQNTSQWVYAVCILYSDGEISRHH